MALQLDNLVKIRLAQEFGEDMGNQISTILASVAAAQSSGGVLDVTGAATFSSTFAAGSNATDRVTIKGFYKNPAVVAVAVPTIADGATDSVVVDVAAAFAIQPAVGDMVFAIPKEALPTDCLLCGAYVTNTDAITVIFGTKEGGSGVTGANKNFDFLILDLT